MVWKHGRLGVKLPNEETYQELLNKKGAEPWKAGPMKMASWVLVPDSFHSKASELKKWVQTAYDQCRNLEKNPKKTFAKKAKVKK